MSQRSTATLSLHTQRRTVSNKPTERQPKLDVNARVRILVDAYFPKPVKQPAKKIPGNVAQAARAWRMSQRGLAKIYSGDVRDPRISSLMAIAKALWNHEDPLWITTGRPAYSTKQLRTLHLHSDN